jgi:hypothetical protein
MTCDELELKLGIDAVEVRTVINEHVIRNNLPITLWFKPNGMITPKAIVFGIVSYLLHTGDLKNERIKEFILRFNLYTHIATILTDDFLFRLERTTQFINTLKD